MSFYYFHSLIFKNKYKRNFRGSSNQVDDMKNGFGLLSGCLFSLCQNMSLPPSFMRLEKNHKSYCLMSTWLG